MRRAGNGATLIFDLDGTLIDTAADLAAAMNHALLGAGRAAVDPAAVRHLVGHGAEAMLRRGFEETGGMVGESDLERALAAFLKYYEAHIADHSAPFDGVIQTIETARAAGWCVTICTNKREQLARLLVGQLGLTHLFEKIVGADTVGEAKPSAAPVLHCLEGDTDRSAIFVGDSDTDIRASQAAGIACCIFDGGYGPLALAPSVTAVFSDYGALPAIIDEIGAD